MGWSVWLYGKLIDCLFQYKLSGKRTTRVKPRLT
jgi:hypothetical protein